MCQVGLMLLMPYYLQAEQLSGRVVDEQKRPLPGATIQLNGVDYTQSNVDGYFIFKDVKSLKNEIKVSMIGFQSIKKTIEGTEFINIELSKSAFVSEEVLVTSSRVNEKGAATFSMINKKDLAKTNLVQDLPYLLNQIPSTVVTSDAGTGIGYTGMRIRGTDASRTNVSINGIPLNDAESQGTFLVNLPDLASSIESIQVQRGVGSSSNGAGAFGASINIQTDRIETEPSSEFNITHGSFGTERYNAKVNTGVINKYWSFNGRLSKISSRGYMDNSSAMMHSIYTSAVYADKKNLMKFVVMTGHEKTYLAYLGVPFDSLNTNRKYNPIAEVYADQTDNYQQDHYQIFYTRIINESTKFSLGYHFTRGQGFYQEYKQDQAFASYGLSNIYIGNDSITTTDLIRQRFLFNEFQGVVFSFEKTFADKLNLIIGGAANNYDGEHYGEIAWAKNASNSSPLNHFYDGTGDKNEISFYAKSNYKINSKWNVYLDLQGRLVDYKITGIDVNLIDRTQAHTFQFFNPKAGATYEFSPTQLAYVSYGVANKEPNRDDFVNAKLNRIQPLSEHLEDLEIGYKARARKYSYEINLFHMNYKNQLIPTGRLNDVGESIRENTPKSFRSGVEITGTWKVFSNFTFSGNIAYSLNKIKEYAEFIYDYDSVSYSIIDTVQNNFKQSDIAYSPSLIAAGRFTYQPITALSIALESKWVGKQYLDNTKNDNRIIESFFVNDMFITYRLQVKRIKSIDLILKVNNVFNELYSANGYTFSYLTNGQNTTARYYYPQAERNYLVGCNFKF